MNIASCVEPLEQRPILKLLHYSLFSKVLLCPNCLGGTVKCSKKKERKKKKDRKFARPRPLWFHDEA